MSGTRPNPFVQFFYDRGVRLAAGLAVVVAIPMAVLFYFQFKSLNDIETTSAVVLRQLSSETADSLTRSIEDYLKRPHISVLLRIPQARTEPLDLPFIEPIFNDALAESPFVESFFVWSEVGPQANKWLVFDQASKALPSGDVEQRFREDKVVGDKLLRRLRELVKTRRAIVAFTETINGRPHYVQAQLRFEGAGARAHDQRAGVRGRRREAAHRSSFRRCCATGWRPSSSRRDSRISRPKCWTKTASTFSRRIPSAAAMSTPVDERSFAIIFFDKELLEFAAPYEQHREIWGLRTSYGPQPIPEIVSASTRPQQALMIVLAVAMALGVFLVAGAAAREVRVAELKSNFVASVSHDLKTPLALIQLFAETLELGRVRTPDRAQEYYRIINGESKKLTRLIENILDFSRMEAGLRPYRMEPADLSESVNKVLARMETQFSQGNFTVTPKIEAGPAAHPRRRRRRRTGDREPARQRDEVFGRREAHRDRGQARQRPHRGQRHRSRHRHLAARAGPHLPQVLSRAARARRRPAGHRPRPGDRRSHDARPRRLRARRERARARQHVLAALPDSE